VAEELGLDHVEQLAQPGGFYEAALDQLNHVFAIMGEAQPSNTAVAPPVR
jgi:hypothetical protein